MTSRKFINIIVLLLILDQVTKFLVRSFMYLGQIIPFTGFFQLTYVTNTGIAFSMFSGGNLVFSITTAIIICAVCIWYAKNRKNFGALISTSLLFIISGATGNLIDRVMRGHVIDFLEFHLSRYYWPAFNMADSYITVGGTILFLSILVTPKSPQLPH